jgi:hypothetical protein
MSCCIHVVHVATVAVRPVEVVEAGGHSCTGTGDGAGAGAQLVCLRDDAVVIWDRVPSCCTLVMAGDTFRLTPLSLSVVRLLCVIHS